MRFVSIFGFLWFSGGEGQVAARIAWGITGAGHFLPEVVELLQSMQEVDLFLSRAGEEVIRSYGLESMLSGRGHRVFYDKAASAPAIGKLYRGYYCVVVVAPATSNSVAKFVCGIADSLVTNLFAQAGKARVPSLVLPTDIAPELISRAPGGNVQVCPREIDRENIRRLEAFANVKVVKNVSDLAVCLNTYL
jgi:flavoprotein